MDKRRIRLSESFPGLIEIPVVNLRTASKHWAWHCTAVLCSFRLRAPLIRRRASTGPYIKYRAVIVPRETLFVETARTLPK